MSQTATRLPQVTAWNMASPLRVLVIEHATADAELYLHELQQAGFQCRPHIVGTPEEFLDHFRRFQDIRQGPHHRPPNLTFRAALVEIIKAGKLYFVIIISRTLSQKK